MVDSPIAHQARIVTRHEAKASGLKRYYTGIPCRNGHVNERSVANGSCMICADECAKKSRTLNPHPNRARAAAWRKANPEKHVNQIIRWRTVNQKKHRAWNRSWAKAHLPAFAANCSRRYAAKTQSTPSWADMNAIKAVYAECARISADTGIKHHVDHFYPLRGKFVCGLHVAGNLRIIPAVENLKKNNRMPVDIAA